MKSELKAVVKVLNVSFTTIQIWLLLFNQAEEIMRKTLNETKSVDRWTAAQCLAYYGECDSDVVGELVSQMLNTEDRIRHERAAHLLAKLSESSVRSYKTLVFLDIGFQQKLLVDHRHVKW